MVDVGKKLWGFCHTLRHEGISYTRYIEQITCLLFIKMADERGIRTLETITYEELGETRTTARPATRLARLSCCCTASRPRRICSET